MFSKNMAMDLGTANTLIYVKGKGIILNEPSVVAYEKKTGRILAVGQKAKNFIGRAPHNIAVVRPLKDGVIADFDVAQAMIKEFFLKVQKMSRFFKPKAVICVPAGITQIEKKAVIDSAEESGVRKVYLIEEPMAAAIGANIDISQNKGQMVIDIGGGTTEVAVLSISSVAYSESVRVAGDEINETIGRYLLKNYRIQVGENTAEKCKMEIGSAYPVDGLSSLYNIAGKDSISSSPKEISLSAEEIRKAIEEPVYAVIDAIRRALEKTPPDLVVDINMDGMYLTGGGALLKGLDKLIHKETKIKCNVIEDPLVSVVLGSGKALEDMEKYSRVFIN